MEKVKTLVSVFVEHPVYTKINILLGEGGHREDTKVCSQHNFGGGVFLIQRSTCVFEPTIFAIKEG